MSVDTRTPRFDEQPALSMTKVDCDPAQVIVNHASFRVRLAPGQRTRLRGVAPAARIPAMSGAGAAAPARRRSPVVWSGRSEPGDPGATGLLQAVRNSTAARLDEYGAGHDDGRDAGATQLIPRFDDTQPNPVVLVPPQQGPSGAGPLLPPMRRAVGAYDDGPVDGAFPDDTGPDGETDEEREARVRRSDAVRHAYYPGRRMNLGVVLLPMRVFLGFISIYAGMGKLCDPVYFDGGDRGSMVKWLTSLHPWALAEPLRDFALSHPVGAGLTVAFLQVVVGVLTVLGLWQRVAASFATLLSVTLLVTVSWRTVAAYDAPDIIYLAAWSPLIIAGAPVYSVDGRLAGEAWRKLGPRSGIWDLRRRVLRRGAVVATVVVGLTLLIGSVLGGAVRSSGVVTVPGPDNPTNQLPGSPLPEESRDKGPSRSPEGRTPEPARSSADTKPSAEQPTPSSDTVREPGRTSGAGESSESDNTGRQPSHQSSPHRPSASSSGSSGPSSSGSDGDGGGSSSSGGSDGGGSTGGDGGGDGGTSGGGQNPIGGLLG
ncbi:DoxX family membrane protein [Streptomyces sp. DT24]|uniref:DoxX family membrane protein n=1 Tax=unclassified Streptomyces TaxID=2593676 RepID=UPI0023B9D5EF|nr:DoxX family membrane protein [Streptomyces sp. AM 4-1-1]WEH34218.1 DoxX family membrane protein [Streptomyces sp. AM 4-1-1]